MSDKTILKLQKFLVKNEFNSIDLNKAKHVKQLIQEEEDEDEEEEYSPFNILLNWNKVLSNLVTKEAFALIYEKRSKIYKQMYHPIECLNNITWAEEHKIEKNLTKRKEFCQLQIQQSEPKIAEPFFNLTHPPNPRMPFVIDYLKLENNTYYGNYIVSNHDLNIGDVLCIEEPLFKRKLVSFRYDNEKMFEKDSAHQRCGNCYQFSNMSLKPCVTCNTLMFCSNHCQDEAMNIFHSFECVISHKVPDSDNAVRSMRSFFITLYLYKFDIVAMKESFEQRGSKVQTVFDYDLSNPESSNRNLMNVFDSYNAPEINFFSQEIYDKIFKCDPFLASIWKDNEQFIYQFLVRHASNLQELGHVLLKWPGNTTKLMKQLSEIPDRLEINTVLKTVGLIYFPFFRLFNHSCIPNVMYNITEQNQLVLIACRQISQGEHLFVDYTENSYFCNLPKADRLKILMEDYSFVCNCGLCLQPYTFTFGPLSNNQIINKRKMKQKIRCAAKGVKTWNRQKARKKYLYFIKLLQRFDKLLPRQELCIVREWVHIALAIMERPDSSF